MSQFSRDVTGSTHNLHGVTYIYIDTVLDTDNLHFSEEFLEFPFFYNFARQMA